MNLYVQCERVRDGVWGVLLGPYDWVQLTYDELRIAPDGERLAYIDLNGDWKLTVTAGEHVGQHYSDLVISAMTAEQAEEISRLNPASYRPPREKEE